MYQAKLQHPKTFAWRNVHFEFDAAYRVILTGACDPIFYGR